MAEIFLNLKEKKKPWAVELQIHNPALRAQSYKRNTHLKQISTIKFDICNNRSMFKEARFHSEGDH